MRRYAIIQKARDADVIGILVGTLGVGKYRSCEMRVIRLMTAYSVLLALDGPLTSTSIQGPKEMLYHQCRET
jgi:diphthamide synthase subunit DPH2